jgi:hypothetical protein
MTEPNWALSPNRLILLDSQLTAAAPYRRGGGHVSASWAYIISRLQQRQIYGGDGLKGPGGALPKPAPRGDMGLAFECFYIGALGMPDLLTIASLPSRCNSD